eukprot:4905939-Prymnesium_polylepis.1
MVRVDVTADGRRPGICLGDRFCCQPTAADRAWFLIDGESASPSHSAWFQPLAQAAEFENAISAARSTGGGSSRRRRAPPQIQSLATWRSQRTDALIPRVPSF